MYNSLHFLWLFLPAYISFGFLNFITLSLVYFTNIFLTFFPDKTTYLKHTHIMSTYKKSQWEKFTKQAHTEDVVDAIINPRMMIMKIINTFVMAEMEGPRDWIKLKNIVREYVEENVERFPAIYLGLATEYSEMCLIVKHNADIDIDLTMTELIRHNLIMQWKKVRNTKHGKRLNEAKKLSKTEIQDLLENSDEEEQSHQPKTKKRKQNQQDKNQEIIQQENINSTSKNQQKNYKEQEKNQYQQNNNQEINNLPNNQQTKIVENQQESSNKKQVNIVQEIVNNNLDKLNDIEKNDFNLQQNKVNKKQHEKQQQDKLNNKQDEKQQEEQKNQKNNNIEDKQTDNEQQQEQATKSIGLHFPKVYKPTDNIVSKKKEQTNANKFNTDEDVLLLKFVFTGTNLKSVKGNALWEKELKRQKHFNQRTLPDRPFLSLRNRLRVLASKPVYTLRSLLLTEDQIKKLKKTYGQ